MFALIFTQYFRCFCLPLHRPIQPPLTPSVWRSLSPGECDKLRINYQYQCITGYKSHALAATVCGLAETGETASQLGLASLNRLVPGRRLSPLIRPSATADVAVAAAFAFAVAVAASAVSNKGNTAANFRCRFYGTLPINIYLQCHNY